MKFNRYPIQKIIVFVLYLFAVNIVVAQTTDTINFSGQTNDYKMIINPELYSPLPHPSLFNQLEFVAQPLKSTKINPSFYNLEERTALNRFTFMQNKEIKNFSNLGAYEHYKNDFIYKVGNHTTLHLGLGLLKQNSVLNLEAQNYHFSFFTSFEYAFNEWLSAYFYGQYVTPVLNNSTAKLDPLIQMNPMFYQTEVGAGLRAKYKNIKTDVGMRNIYDTQFKSSNPVQFMDTKISIGF